MTSLWNASERYLEQARSLVSRLSKAQYSAPQAHCYGGTIGGHLRHCLEHFDGFRRGVERGAIDYDDRKRGTPEESDPFAAAEALDDLKSWFRENGGRFESGQGLRIKVDCGEETGEPHWEKSTIGRELQFLASHTVHHFAIIGIMCDAQTIPIDPDFGMAPSTLKSLRREQVAG